MINLLINRKIKLMKLSLIMVTNSMHTKSKTLLILVFFIITVVLSVRVQAQDSNNDFVVVLDAGHGGKDSGNLGSGYKEKSIALKIVLEVGKSLEKNKNIKVIYTRKTDVFLELRERAAIANKVDADLFVSIHCNAHNSEANGTETFVLGAANTKRNLEIAKKENEVIYFESDYEKNYDGFDPNSPESLIGLTLIQEDYIEQSVQLARMVENNFKLNLKRKSRGVKQASLWVMHNTYMPSVLVEVGFLTYKREGAFLNSRAGQLKMSASIAKAIESYKRELDQNIVDYYEVETEVVTEAPIILKETEAAIYNNIIFKIQIAAGSKKLEPKPFNFKGLKDVARVKDGKLYKYYYGYTSDYNKIQAMQDYAKKKGYESSFVVAYKNNERIDLSKALKSGVN